MAFRITPLFNNGTTGDPVMDAFNAKQKRKKEFEKTGKAKKAKVVEAKGASIKESGPSKEIIKAKPTVKKTEPKDNSRKAIRKRKKAESGLPDKLYNEDNNY